MDNPVRDKWRMEQRKCHWPGCQADGTDVHEIVGGYDRAMTVRMPSAWLYLCRTHHNKLPSRPSEESLIEQLAVKLFADPKHSDSKSIIRVWRPNCTRIFMDDIQIRIAQWWSLIQRIHGNGPNLTK